MTMGIMEVTLVGAKGLKHADFFSKIDPYVVIKYRNQEQISSTLKGRGTRPVWNEKFKFNVEYPLSQEDNINDQNCNNYKLFLEVMDRDTFTADDYLGKATIYLKELFEIGVEEGKADLGVRKYRVVLSDLTYHGEIKVGITFSAQLDRKSEDAIGSSTSARGMKRKRERERLVDENMMGGGKKANTSYCPSL